MGPEDIIRNATLKAILDGVQPAAFAERGAANLDQIVGALRKHKAKIVKEAGATDDEEALVAKVCSVPAEESTEADKMRLVKIWARTVISKRYFTVGSYTKDYTSIILRIVDRECWDEVPKASAEVMTFLLRDWYNNAFGVESLLPHIVDARNEALRRDEEKAEMEVAAQAEKMRLAEEKKLAQKEKSRRAKRPLEPASAPSTADAAQQPPAAKKPRQESGGGGSGAAAAVVPPPPPQAAPAQAAPPTTPTTPAVVPAATAAAAAAPSTPATPSTPFVEEVSADTAKGTFAAPTVQEPADVVAPAAAAAAAAAAVAAAPAAAVEAKEEGEDEEEEDEITMERIVSASKQIVMQLRMGAVGVSTAHDLAEVLELPEELVKATIKIMEEHLQVMFDPEVGAVYLL
eukprot:Rhum_TRINITY_DN13244_c0_g2::Rhum_TRINITY_DN13244_c0_g2_i1::g.57981::m.57981